MFHFMSSLATWDVVILVLIKTVSKWKLLLNDCYMTVSGHFFTICMVIFHKTEVETVVLKYLTYLNLNQLKSYGVKCILSLCPTLANSEKIATDKWWFYHYFWPVFCQLHVCLSQNWSSDGHFEVLDESKSYKFTMLTSPPVLKLWGVQLRPTFPPF